MRKTLLRRARYSDDQGEVASWLVMMAGLAMAAALAVPVLQSTIADLAQKVGNGERVELASADPSSGGPDTSGGDGGDAVDRSNHDPLVDGPGGEDPDDPDNADLGRPDDEPPVEDWEVEAFIAAGIDPADWDPEAGVDGNQQIIEDVYTYYGDLYLNDPNMQWAGMANMIGPSFAAGFYDLDLFQDLANSVAATMSFNPDLAARFTEFAANLTASELEWYEREFLKMQREIFIDQAPAHEAYRQGGIDGIDAMFEAGDIDRQMHLAWTTIHEGIETGNERLIAEGNQQLLHREQFDIIRDNYDTMADRPGGEIMTYLMTLIGQPSIPGAQSYAEVFPIVISTDVGPGPSGACLLGRCVDNPAHVTVEVTTPLPNGNIANFDDRWNLIIEDTLPAYQAVLADPDLADEIVSSSVADRIDDNRLDVDAIIDVLSNFDLNVEQ